MLLAHAMSMVAPKLRNLTNRIDGFAGFYRPAGKETYRGSTLTVAQGNVAAKHEIERADAGHPLSGRTRGSSFFFLSNYARAITATAPKRSPYWNRASMMEKSSSK